MADILSKGLVRERGFDPGPGAACERQTQAAINTSHATNSDERKVAAADFMKMEI
jgi:hypothetical protein